MTYRFIEAEKANHSVRLMCRVLQVSSSGFYAWQRRGPSSREQEDAQLTDKIRAVHRKSRRSYGAPRVHAVLGREGLRVGRKRVARLMRAARLSGCSRRRGGTTRRDPKARPAPDRVERRFVAPGPDRLWCADISYLPTGEGWLYLAVILDVFSRRVVGWAVADHLRSELVVDALAMAVRRRRLSPGLVHHSDQGCQYTSLTFGQRLRAAQILPSMGSVGDAYDNALAESFFATLKCELAHQVSWHTHKEAELDIFEWIEGFYNRVRLHSALDYLSPLEYELHHQTMSHAA